MIMGCRRFSGFSLFSVMVAVLITSALAVTIYKFAKDSRENAQVMELVNAIRTLKSASMRHFAPNMNNNYLYQKLKAEKAVPFDWKPYDAAGRWNTPLWGDVFVGPLVGGYDAYSPAVIGAGDALLITVSRVQRELCFNVLKNIERDFDFMALDNSNRRILKNYNVPFDHKRANAECAKSKANVWLGLMVY